MIPPGELAQLRAEMERFLPDLCTIRRYPNATHAPATGTTFGAPADTPNVPCRAAPIGPGDERLIGAQLMAVARYMVSLPVATDVRNADQILWSGHVFEVLSVPRRSQQITLRVPVSEVS